MEFSVIVKGKSLPVAVSLKKMKQVRLKVFPSCEIKLSAPIGTPDEWITEYLASKTPWIEEKLELFHRAKSFVGDHCLILAGTGCNSTSRTAELSLAAQEEGVDGLLVVSPYYNKATAEGLVAHYLTVAHSIRIPMILYNVPSRTGVDIPLSVYRRLAPIPNIIGVKEAGSDLTKITRTCSTCGDFFVWTGNDDYIVPAMSLGAQGIISVLSNVVPVETQAMTSAMLAGDLDTATALQQQLQPLIDLLFCEVNPIPVKAAMKYLGYDCGGCRLPLTE